MRRLALCAMAFWALGFRPFHFTATITSDFSEFDDIGDVTWTQSGSILTVTAAANSQGWIYRDADASVDSTVEIRARTTTAGANSFFWAVITNWQSDTQFYMCQVREDTNQVKLFLQNSGFFALGTVSHTVTQNTWYTTKLTATDNGANKDLDCFMDGSSVNTASTGTKLGSGQAGIYGSPSSASASGEIDWFAFDLSLGATSIAPDMGRHSGAQSVTITGTSFGDEMQLGMDGLAATNIVSTPTTSITGDTPATFAGPYDVVVGFGTAGSAEYAVTIANGFTYRLMGGLGTTGGGF